MAALIPVLVALIIVGALLYLMEILPIDATIKTVIRVIVIVAVCIWLLYFLMNILPGTTLPHVRN